MNRVTLLERAVEACDRAARADDDNWDAPEADEARCLTAELGLVWDFSTWGHARDVVVRMLDDEQAAD
jgi:hypothetical protein